MRRVLDSRNSVIERRGTPSLPNSKQRWNASYECIILVFHPRSEKIQSTMHYTPHYFFIRRKMVPVFYVPLKKYPYIIEIYFLVLKTWLLREIRSLFGWKNYNQSHFHLFNWCDNLASTFFSPPTNKLWMNWAPSLWHVQHL